MSDPVDSAIDQTENESKKKGPRGARDRYYFCAAMRGKSIVHDVIKAKTVDEAKEAFKDAHNQNASVVEDGSNLKGGGSGFYLAMSGQNESQRISVTVSAQQLARRTTKAITGEFRGWKVYGSGLKGCQINDETFGDNELFSLEFEERLNPDDKSLHKPKLKKKEVIRLSDIENVQDLSA